MNASLHRDVARDLDRWLGCSDWLVEPLAGDASVRSYSRVRLPDGRTYILAAYPDEILSDLVRFLAANRALAGVLPVPGVIESSNRAVLQEDAGDVTLSAILSRDRDDGLRLYRESARLLEQLQSAGDDARRINPAFDAAKFREELLATRKFFVEGLARITDPAKLERLDAMLEALAERLTQHPYILCHRDYHGQNINVINGQLKVIDYQDARMGPDTYDLASLLRDRGVWRTIGAEAEQSMLRSWAQWLGDDEAAVRSRYLETLLQRSIKAIGTFAKMSVVYGRHHYLGFIPPTLETMAHCIDQLGQWQEIRELFPFDYTVA